MTDHPHKQRPPVEDIARWLTEHHGAPAVDVVPVRGGYWSSAWSYRTGDLDLILRLGESAEGYRIDQAAESFGSSGIPVPEVLFIGEAFDRAAAISRRHVGSFVEEADPADAVPVGIALTGLLMSMRSVSARSVEWHRDDGEAVDWRRWLSRGLAVDASIEERWTSACEVHAELGEIRDQAVNLIVGWLPSCPERRDLIHRDLLHQNVLIDHDRITGVFSWKHSLFGDFLYDVAACSLWGDWHPGVAGAGMWSRILEETPGADLVDAEPRHRMYQLHIGVEHLDWYVRNGDDTDLLRLLGVMKPLLG